MANRPSTRAASSRQAVETASIGLSPGCINDLLRLGGGPAAARSLARLAEGCAVPGGAPEGCFLRSHMHVARNGRYAAQRAWVRVALFAKRGPGLRGVSEGGRLHRDHNVGRPVIERVRRAEVADRPYARGQLLGALGVRNPNGWLRHASSNPMDTNR